MSSHDEPLVVDNSPLGIDVGALHANPNANPPLLIQEGRDWVRKFSQVNKIVVIRKGVGAHGEIETMSANLDRDRPLILTVTTGSASSDVILKWEGDGSDRLRIQTSGFDFERNDNSRRLEQNGQQRQISQVRWFESTSQTAETKFPASPLSNHESIFVGLYP